ncbi:hypothetical protein HRbin16_02668 [bacterium HR16]|nr:hypothetical protein HRbin16_02668 [bacterium HR16]
MKRFVLFALVAGLGLAVGTAQALTLQPNVATWQSWGVGDLNENGTPYWDGNSDDYNPEPANIGYWLTKTGAFAPIGSAPAAVKNASPGAAYPYLGNADGTAITDVYFQSTTPNWAALKIEIAGLSAWNYFGIYKQGDLPANLNELLTTPPGTIGSSGKSMLLFKGTDGPGASLTFVSPWADFGFYLATEDSANPGNVLRAFFSESSLNSGTELNKQHFAFFQAKSGAYPAYYIGTEDKPLGGSDKDYNDLVVYVQAIPDASTWMLFLSGVPALALLRRKKA